MQRAQDNMRVNGRAQFLHHGTAWSTFSLLSGPRYQRGGIDPEMTLQVARGDVDPEIMTLQVARGDVEPQ